MRPPDRSLLTVRALALGLAAAGAATGQGEVAARFKLGDREATVSRDDLAMELGERYDRTERGKGALKFLVDLELIRNAASEAGVRPTPAQTRSWIQDLEAKLRGAHMSLATLMRQKGLSADDFEEFATLQLTQELLVRRELQLGEQDTVTPSMLRLWSEEARRKAGVVTDAAKLPAGTVARVGDHSLTMLDLGRVLVRTTDPETRRRYVRQIVLERCLQERARQRGIEVSADEMEAEVAARRKQAESNPAYRGLSFEQLLSSQGTSLEELRHSPVLRAQVQERKLVAELLPDAEIDRQLRDQREAVLREHGARRRLQLIAIHIRKGKRNAKAARELAEQVRARIEGGMSFDDAARTYSEDTYGKVSGGDAGWHHRTDKELPEAVLAAAFELEPEKTSAPVETDDAVYLVRVVAQEAEPNDATLRFRIRSEFAAKFRQRVLEEAAIHFEAGY